MFGTLGLLVALGTLGTLGLLGTLDLLGTLVDVHVYVYCVLLFVIDCVLFVL